jgi:prefoldin subunit 5
MTEIRFKLPEDLEAVLVKEQAARKQTLRRSLPLSALVQEYVLKGLLAEGKRVGKGSVQISEADANGGLNSFASLDVQARQIVKDRLELIDLGSKVHNIMDDNSKLRTENQDLRRSLDKARKRIQGLTQELEKVVQVSTQEPTVFLGMTMKELLLVGVPTVMFLFEKYSNGKSEEATEQLTTFKQNISKLPEAQRKEALQVLSHAAIPWPKKLKSEVFVALGANLGT